MILREIFILLLVLAGFASAISAYLFAFHGSASLKEILSTTFAATIGVYVGRFVERRLTRG